MPIFQKELKQELTFVRDNSEQQAEVAKVTMENKLLKATLKQLNASEQVMASKAKQAALQTAFQELLKTKHTGQ